MGTTAAEASNIDDATLILGFDLRASNKTGVSANSIALHSANSTSSLAITDCKFTSARGSDGGVGTPGPSGANGTSPSFAARRPHR